MNRKGIPWSTVGTPTYLVLKAGKARCLTWGWRAGVLFNFFGVKGAELASECTYQDKQGYPAFRPAFLGITQQKSLMRSLGRWFPLWGRLWFSKFSAEMGAGVGTLRRSDATRLFVHAGRQPLPSQRNSSAVPPSRSESSGPFEDWAPSHAQSVLHTSSLVFYSLGMRITRKSGMRIWGKYSPKWITDFYFIFTMNSE